MPLHACFFLSTGCRSGEQAQGIEWLESPNQISLLLQLSASTEACSCRLAFWSFLLLHGSLGLRPIHELELL
ncbi:hypothetical protein MUK42_34306 [Musa troglodytarum]|uniref:Uncharacterized protein n=1 Tax=Musa troglodytarum TaxID=320322 RepID=A0A9E7JCM8_9LILI|nr:hypothetical protein MUK42_34306 [Musa troglodytarum]